MAPEHVVHPRWREIGCGGDIGKADGTGNPSVKAKKNNRKSDNLATTKGGNSIRRTEVILLEDK